MAATVVHPSLDFNSLAMCELLLRSRNKWSPEVFMWLFNAEPGADPEFSLGGAAGHGGAIFASGRGAAYT